jgi:hypothetical protein
MFDMWLICEADWEFPYIYKSAVKGEFSKYVTPEIETLLWISGKNIVYAISTYMDIKKNATLYEILQFTEDFLVKQLDDFDNWCEDIGMAIYEESPEYERDKLLYTTNTITDISSNILEVPSIIPIDTSRDISYVVDNISKEAIAKIKSNINGNNKKDVKNFRRKGTLTYEQFIEKLKKQNGKCYVCLQEFKYDGGKWCNFFPSADRIYNYDIHTDSNVAISCTYCNLRTFKDNFTGQPSKKICGLCPDLNHVFEGDIKTKSDLFYELGNSDSTMYEYAQNLPITPFTQPSQH